jgi:hypothetical protein
MAPHTLTNSETIRNLTIQLKNHGNHLLGQEGATFFNFLPLGNTINAAVCCEMLKNLCQAIQNKQRGLLTRGVCLLHDNAR